MSQARSVNKKAKTNQKQTLKKAKAEAAKQVLISKAVRAKKRAHSISWKRTRKHNLKLQAKRDKKEIALQAKLELRKEKAKKTKQFRKQVKEAKEKREKRNRRSKVALWIFLGLFTAVGLSVGAYFIVKSCWKHGRHEKEEFYDVNVELGEGVVDATVNDAPIGENITGSVRFLNENYTTLNINTSYVKVDGFSPIYGEDAFIYTEKSQQFAVKYTALHNKTHLTIHLDAGFGNPWTGAKISFTQDQAEAHFKQNIYKQPILVEFNISNKYQLDEDLTKTDIYDEDGGKHTYSLGSEVFKIDNDGYLMIDPEQTTFDVTKTSNIKIGLSCKEAQFPYEAHTTEEGFKQEKLKFTDGKGQLYKDVEFTWQTKTGYEVDKYAPLEPEEGGNYIQVVFKDDKTQAVAFVIDTYNPNLWSFAWNYEWEVNTIDHFEFFAAAKTNQ